MKKIISTSVIITILVVALFGLTGCTNNTNINEENPGETTVLTTNKEENKVNVSNQESNVVDTNTISNVTTNTTTSSTKPNVDLGEKYANLDKRSFAVNGKVYTLGVNTLQEMIDDGVPFDENDLSNANNNINKNYESQSFKIVLDKYYTAQVRVTNESNENMKIADCKLSYIYLPVNLDKEQDILSFAFPLTITEEELLANSGEPTDKSEYNGSNDYVSREYKYKVSSTKYYGDSGYTFQFINGKLRYVTITYKP